MRALLAALLLAGATAVHAQIADDPELKKLRAAVKDAPGQGQLNITSGAVAKWLDKQLAAEEDKFRKKLDAAMVPAFDKANTAWREYRSTQVMFEGAFWNGGTIQPLMHNEAFAALTEARIDQMRRLYKETFEQ